MHGQHVLRLEPQIDRVQRYQRANQQGRTDQQNQRETQLTDHQAIMQADAIADRPWCVPSPA